MVTLFSYRKYKFYIITTNSEKLIMLIVPDENYNPLVIYLENSKKGDIF